MRHFYLLFCEVQLMCFSDARFVRCGRLCTQKRKAFLQGCEVLMRAGLSDGDQRDAPGLLVMFTPQAQEIGTLGQFGHNTSRTCVALICAECTARPLIHH